MEWEKNREREREREREDMCVLCPMRLCVGLAHVKSIQGRNK